MIKTELIDDITIVTFVETNRLNAYISEAFEEKIKAYFINPDTRLILDLNGIKFIDSSGFAALLSIMKKANSSSSYFKICNIEKEAKELFKLLHLHNVFEIYNSREDAIISFTNSVL